MKKRLSNNILQVCVSQNVIYIKLKTLTLILENNDYDVLHHMTVLVIKSNITWKLFKSYIFVSETNMNKRV